MLTGSTSKGLIDKSQFYYIINTKELDSESDDVQPIICFQTMNIDRDLETRYYHDSSQTLHDLLVQNVGRSETVSVAGGF